MSKNYEAIKAHYAASDRKDVDGMMAPITGQTVWTEMAGFPYAGTYVGPEAIIAGVFKRIGEEWDDYSFSLERLADAGSIIVGMGTYTGRFKRTGRTMKARVVHVWDMEDGQVVRFEQFTDTKLVVEATN
ncbi:nuclear transport factor 2 family protein [Bradyrhizobium sp. sBnM-33]|uniref:nuclear transport factor 2 family protein n=1 Tax=Bradyrhizobium sp. sBnM-33 TaxID=2831780 RepID=UPI001BCDB76A|nr:nuclear transport factor 2 family protein [Bradyrhizobium sp. sBnM-33]WOH53378.1 nuclear transport factor 2 family protein [Bradyrhizobium sp. sBnM-33]